MVMLSRRAFLAAGGGLLVAAACGSDDSGGAPSGSGGDGTYVALRLSADQYVSGDPQRFAFALTKDDRFFDGPPTTIAFIAPSVLSAPEHADTEILDLEPTIPPTDTVLRAEGLPEGRGIYDARVSFDEAGIWAGIVEVEGQRVELPFEVTALPTTFVAFDPAPRSPSPTPADPMGVDPICTREPECPLHDTSLSELVGAGRPVAIMFATPAFCASQYCGPTLDLLLDLRDEFADRVDLVHVEIYDSTEARVAAPTVQEWQLDSEPWLFGVDGTGTVTERLGGAFDRSEIRELLQRLAG